MFGRALIGFYSSLGKLLQNPLQILWTCLALAFINCVLDGSLLRLWGLHRDHDKLREQVAQLKIENQKVKYLIKKASDPTFIEREARDRFDLVEEGDLVFVFSEN